MSYKLKQKPEDFKVEEIPNYEILPSGDFRIYKLTKRDITTFDAVDQISKRIGVDQKYIRYAGLKDKNAITVQYMSVPNKGNLLEKYEIPGISLELVGYSNNELFVGSLKGNKFDIIIRNIEKQPELHTHMINYFGEQRFSTDNVAIGRFIVKRQFSDAVELILKSNELKTSGKHPTQSLQSVDKKMITLYLSAYQSYLWNKSVEIYLDTEEKVCCKEAMPLIGFGLEAEGKISKILNKVMSEEGIKERDFILRELQGIGLEGGFRDIFAEVESPKIISFEEDDLNPGMKKCRVSFELPKAAYATEYIKQMLS